VLVKNDAYGEIISNSATLRGSDAEGGSYNTTVFITADSVTVPDNLGDDVMTGNHLLLFIGDDNGNWRPYAAMSRMEAALLYYRAVSKPRPSYSGAISDIDSGHWAYDGILYALGKGGLQLDGSGHFRPNDPITLSEFSELARRACGLDFGLSGSGNLTRLQAATLMLGAQGRSDHPVTHGLTLPSFNDVYSSDSYYWIIMEVSHEHDWYTDTSGNEHWTR
jgi:hypothetical protein